MPGSSAPLKQRTQKHRGVHRGFACEVLDLMPAGESRCDDGSSRLPTANGGQQPTFTDRSRDIEVIATVAERARHSATTGIGIDNRSSLRYATADPWRAEAGPSPSDGNGREAESRADRSSESSRARARTLSPLPGILRKASTLSQPPQPFVAHRRGAAKAHPHGRPTGNSARRRQFSDHARAAGYKRIAFSRARSRARDSSPLEISGRPQHTLPARPGLMPASVNTSHPGHADVGVVEVREGVVEDQHIRRTGTLFTGPA